MAARPPWTSRSGSRSTSIPPEDEAFGADDDEPTAADSDEVRVPVGDLPPGRTRLFEFVRGGWDLTGFVVNHDGDLHAYVNRCPHVPYSLDFGDGSVMTPDRRTIICSSHGARFDPETGRCFAGPVVGRSLERLTHRREGDTLVVTITPEPAGWPRNG